MPYVRRNESQEVVAQYANPQEGLAAEWLPDEHQDLHRPSDIHIWVDGSWVEDPQLHERSIKEMIASIEWEDLMNRRAREAFLLQAEEIALERFNLTPAQLYQVNQGYRGAKDIDNQIKALRDQL
jgi:hypothetical protein